MLKSELLHKEMQERDIVDKQDNQLKKHLSKEQEELSKENIENQQLKGLEELPLEEQELLLKDKEDKPEDQPDKFKEGLHKRQDYWLEDNLEEFYQIELPKELLKDQQEALENKQEDKLRVTQSDYQAELPEELQAESPEEL